MNNRVCRFCGEEYYPYDLHTCRVEIQTSDGTTLDDQLPLFPELTTGCTGNCRVCRNKDH